MAARPLDDLLRAVARHADTRSCVLMVDTPKGAHHMAHGSKMTCVGLTAVAHKRAEQDVAEMADQDRAMGGMRSFARMMGLAQ